MEIPKIIQGKYLLITASGSHFRYVKEQPNIDTGIVKLTKTVIKLLLATIQVNDLHLKYICIFFLITLDYQK